MKKLIFIAILAFAAYKAGTTGKAYAERTISHAIATASANAFASVEGMEVDADKATSHVSKITAESVKSVQDKVDSISSTDLILGK